jgi:hypothetical protein
MMSTETNNNQAGTTVTPTTEPTEPSVQSTNTAIPVRIDVISAQTQPASVQAAPLPPTVTARVPHEPRHQNGKHFQRAPYQPWYPRYTAVAVQQSQVQAYQDGNHLRRPRRYAWYGRRKGFEYRDRVAGGNYDEGRRGDGGRRRNSRRRGENGGRSSQKKGSSSQKKERSQRKKLPKEVWEKIGKRPNRPLTAFKLFLNDKLPDLQKETSNATVTELIQILCNRWLNALTPEEKGAYKTREKEVRAKFHEDMKKYTDRKEAAFNEFFSSKEAIAAGYFRYPPRRGNRPFNQNRRKFSRQRREKESEQKRSASRAKFQNANSYQCTL